MATDLIQVSTQVLLDTAQKMRSINSNLDEKLHEINKTMNDLESSYRSDAATEIRANMNAMKPTFENYSKIIDEYAKHLETSAQLYESREGAIQSNASAFKTMK